MSLEGRDLTFRIGGKTLVEDVSLTVSPGEIAAIVGTNGAGKSALLRLLSGDVRPERGSVTLEGKLKIDNPPDAPKWTRVGLFAAHPSQPLLLGNFGTALALIDTVQAKLRVLPSRKLLSLASGTSHQIIRPAPRSCDGQENWLC